MKLLTVVLCVLALAPAAHAKLLVEETYYRSTNASLHVFVRNDGSRAVRLLPPVVNGFDAAMLGRDGRHSGPVLWYRSRPNPIPSGGMADVVIALAQPSDKPASIELRSDSSEPLKVTVGCIPEKIRFQAIRFSRDLRFVDVYARWNERTGGDSLKTLKIDGRSVAVQASPWPAESSDGLAYTRISLPKPLAKGSFHVFHATTRAGLSTAYQVRAIPSEFLIGVYGTPSPENIRDWAAHGCNHYLSFGSVSPDLLERLSSSGLSVGAKYISEQLVDRPKGVVVACDEKSAKAAVDSVRAEPSLRYHELVDEPDAADHYAGNRLGASSMELVARAELCRELDPERYTFVQLDNTFRPNNYRVYGEIADVLATHRYSLGSVIQGEAGYDKSTQLSFLDDLRDTMARFRGATEPNRMLMVTQFFDLGKNRLGRAPTIEEMRLQCYMMIAGGASGLIHYIHSGSGGGHEGAKTPELWDAMTAMHAELKRIGEVADMGTPAPESWAKTGNSYLRASAVLAGDRMAVIVVNAWDRSALEGFTARPIRAVPVTVHIPSWIDASRLQVVDAEDSKAVASALQGSELTFTLDLITDAKGFLIQPAAR